MEKAAIKYHTADLKCILFVKPQGTSINHFELCYFS